MRRLARIPEKHDYPVVEPAVTEILVYTESETWETVTRPVDRTSKSEQPAELPESANTQTGLERSPKTRENRAPPSEDSKGLSGDLSGPPVVAPLHCHV
jgi:hypothetical protein